MWHDIEQKIITKAYAQFSRRKTRQDVWENIPRNSTLLNIGFPQIVNMLNGVHLQLELNSRKVREQEIETEMVCLGLS